MGWPAPGTWIEPGTVASDTMSAPPLCSSVAPARRMPMRSASAVTRYSLPIRVSNAAALK